MRKFSTIKLGFFCTLYFYGLELVFFIIVTPALPPSIMEVGHNDDS